MAGHSLHPRSEINDPFGVYSLLFEAFGEKRAIVTVSVLTTVLSISNHFTTGMPLSYTRFIYQ
jgi:hypothetical protein